MNLTTDEIQSLVVEIDFTVWLLELLSTDIEKYSASDPELVMSSREQVAKQLAVVSQLINRLTQEA